MRFPGLCFLGASLALAGCGGGVTHPGDGDGGITPPLVDARPCQGLECRQVHCSGGGTTSVSGVVNIPAGTLPIYNAIVYVPNAPLLPLGEGVSCDRCDDLLSGSPLVRTTTDTMGRFSLSDMPVGQDIPLVVQLGKWRREVRIPMVSECVDTPLDAAITRLPKDQGEGHIPRIALTTGGADALECLLLKVGLDPAEFTPETGTGRVNFYDGSAGTNAFSPAYGGAAFTPATTFWANVDTLGDYDVVLLSCEGAETPTNKSVTDRLNMQQYLNAGGRVFASHWHNFWLEFGPDPFPTVATFNHQPDLANPFTALIDTTFEKGLALAEWLLNVGGSTVFGELVINAAQHTVVAVNGNLAQRWIYSDTPQSVQYLTANTPMGVPPEDQCGRIVLSDIHVSSGDVSNPSNPFPNGCTTTALSAQEKALIFMLFDLSSCIVPDVE